jgi:transcriptional regulator with XRE-family HTH domain
MPFGKRLKKLREDRALSQENVADELGVSQPAYSKWESSQTDISYETLNKIAEFYGITLSELFEGIT